MALTNQELTALYERHVNMVYRLCFTFMKNQADTEDAVQNTFMKLLRSGRHFETDEHEKAWLIVTASNTCRDALRRASRKDQSLDDARQQIAAPPQDSNPVLEAVLGLPEKYRQLIYLFYYEGYTSKELEEILNRPASTLRSQLREARALLKNEL